MDDTLKSVIYGFLGLIVFHAALEKRATDDTNRQVREAFRGNGTVRTNVEPRGMFGAFANRFYSVSVHGIGLQTDQLPFVTVPRPGWKGQIRHLRLRFDQLLLKGLPVEHFLADIPNVSYDLGHALYKDRLVIRGAGEGLASVEIRADGLRLFVLQKYRGTLDDIEVSFRDNKVAIRGRLLFLGASAPFSAIGELDARDGRYVDLVRASAEMNGRPVSPAALEDILRRLNPVLDISADLALEGYLTISRVEIGTSSIVITGKAAIPARVSGIRTMEERDGNDKHK